MLTLTVSAFKLTIPIIVLILLVMCFCSRAALDKMPAVLDAITRWKYGNIDLHVQRQPQ